MSIPKFAAAALSVALLFTAGCTSSSNESGDGTPDADVLAAAKQKLDDATGVQLGLSTTDLPQGVTGLVSASGRVTHAPAFDGTITVATSIGNVDAPVVAVGGKVYADTPLPGGFEEINPADYGAPDPAKLLDPNEGISTFLVKSEGVARGEDERCGADNSDVCSNFTGTLPAETVKTLIATASGDSFDTSYRINGAGELTSATLTGQFYPDAAENSYTVTFADYNAVDTNITAP